MAKKKKSDYLKAVKRADRLISLENSTGFTLTTRIHKSKKLYDRKKMKICVEDYL